jgi:uncharacterized protein
VIIDAHVSVGPDPGYPSPGPGELLRLLDRSGVDRAVLGPVGAWAAVDNADGNRELSSWVRRHPDRLAAWAAVNPWYGAKAVAEVDRALDDGAVGLKLIPAVQGHSLLSPVLEPVLDAAEARRALVYAVTGTPVAAEPLQLAELARRRPRLVFVMGRSGRTDFALDLVPALTSATNLVAETAYNAAGLIGDLVGRLGAGRVVFASDAPRNLLPLELDRVRRADLGADELAAVLGGSLTELLRGVGRS